MVCFDSFIDSSRQRYPEAGGGAGCADCLFYENKESAVFRLRETILSERIRKSEGRRIGDLRGG